MLPAVSTRKTKLFIKIDEALRYSALYDFEESCLKNRSLNISFMTFCRFFECYAFGSLFVSPVHRHNCLYDLLTNFNLFKPADQTDVDAQRESFYDVKVHVSSCQLSNELIQLLNQYHIIDQFNDICEHFRNVKGDEYNVYRCRHIMSIPIKSRTVDDINYMANSAMSYYPWANVKLLDIWRDPELKLQDRPILLQILERIRNCHPLAVYRFVKKASLRDLDLILDKLKYSEVKSMSDTEWSFANFEDIYSKNNDVQSAYRIPFGRVLII